MTIFSIGRAAVLGLFLASTAGCGPSDQSASKAQPLLAPGEQAFTKRPAADISKGICQESNIRWIGDLAPEEQRNIPVGKYLINSTPAMSFNIALVGGGGAGGGTTIGTWHRLWGGGGYHGEIKHWLGYKFGDDVLLLVVGGGGKPVTGSKNWRDWGKNTVPGNPGSVTAILSCSTQQPILHVDGGTGGKGDSYDIGSNRPHQHAGNGEAMVSPYPNEGTIGTGGPGGIWQASGAPGTGFGAGGGGEGGHDGNGSTSGAGARGSARVIIIQ